MSLLNTDHDQHFSPPLDTGTGALSMEDIQLMRTSYGCYHSRAPDQGFLVVGDYSRYPPWYDSKMHTRIMMYVTTIMTDPINQTDGATIVYVAQSSSAGPVVTDTDPEGWKMLKEGAPFRAKQLIVARAVVEGKEGVLKLFGLPALLRQRISQWTS